MLKYNHSFIIARFQPFHIGHKTIIDKMLEESKNVTIILGSAQESKTEKNPLNVLERQQLIENIYGIQNNIKILSLNDLGSQDIDIWYNYVMDFLKKKVSQFGFPNAYYCGDMENGHWYDKGEFKIEILNREKQNGLKKISATEIRNMIKSNNQNWKNYIPKENIKLIETFFNINK